MENTLNQYVDDMIQTYLKYANQNRISFEEYLKIREQGAKEFGLATHNKTNNTENERKNTKIKENPKVNEAKPREGPVKTNQNAQMQWMKSLAD